MSLTGFQYPAAPLSTAVPAPVSTTTAAMVSSFERYNNKEIEIVFVSKGATPLYSTLKGMGRQQNGGEFKSIGFSEAVVENFPEFKWIEKGDQKELFAASTTIASGVTSLVLATNVGLIPGHIIRNVTTNEEMRVSSVNVDGVTVVVQRAVGTKSAEQSTSGDAYLIVATAAAEGQASVETIGVAGIEQSNYFQKFLTTITATDFQSMSYKVGGAGMDMFMRDQAIIHARELEKTLLFGQKKASTDPSGERYYKMEGVLEMCKRGHTDDLSSTLTAESLAEALSRPLQYTNNGSAKKIGVCGVNVLAKIRALFVGQLQTATISEVDMTFNTLTLNNGTYVFLSHPMMDENSGYANDIAVIDPAFLTLIYPTAEKTMFQGGSDGKTKFQKVDNETNFARQKGSYVTYMSLKNAHANAGGLFRI